MENSFKTKEPQEKTKGKFKNKLDDNSRGKITNFIGRGEDARNSFVYLTLKWSFIVGSLLTVLLIINSWCFVTNLKVPDLTGDITNVWEIVFPVITLALGYAFGKSKD